MMPHYICLKFERISLSEDISKEADIAKGTFYLYFSSRNATLEYLFERFLSHEEAVLVEQSFEQDPRVTVLNTIEGIIDRAAERLDFVPIFWEVAGHQAVQSECQLSNKISKLFNKLSKKIESVLLNAQTAGLINEQIDIPIVI